MISIFIKNSKICDKYYLKRRLDMDLKIKTETEEFHGRTCGIIKQENKFLIMRVNKTSTRRTYRNWRRFKRSSYS